MRATEIVGELAVWGPKMYTGPEGVPTANTAQDIDVLSASGLRIGSRPAPVGTHVLANSPPPLNPSRPGDPLHLMAPRIGVWRVEDLLLEE